MDQQPLFSGAPSTADDERVPTQNTEAILAGREIPWEIYSTVRVCRDSVRSDDDDDDDDAAFALPHALFAPPLRRLVCRRG